MRIYCFCGRLADNKGPNRAIWPDSERPDGIPVNWAKQPTVVLENRMVMEGCGIQQAIVDKTTGLASRHYPNCDLYVCPICKVTVAVE